MTEAVILAAARLSFSSTSAHLRSMPPARSRSSNRRTKLRLLLKQTACESWRGVAGAGGTNGKVLDVVHQLKELECLLLHALGLVHGAAGVIGATHAHGRT